MDLQVLTLKELNFSTVPPVAHPAQDLRWLRVLHEGLGHEPMLLRATQAGSVIGEMPLVLVRGPIFGRFLVGLSYLNSGGLRTTNTEAGAQLIDKAIELTELHDCRYLELRHETPWEHTGLNAELTTKVHMRFELPQSVEDLRSSLKAKVRNQVKKGESQGFKVTWGGRELLDDFYHIFAIRMRDLGTPVFSRKLFYAILIEFPELAEICCVYDGRKAIAAALIVHGTEVTEVPSASALTSYNSSNANMLLYWNLLTRSVERKQSTFDFGRSTLEGPTYNFKKQWGAVPHPAHWQYHLRHGNVDDMRPDSGKKKILIRAWQHLPVWTTRILGPPIVRGIP